MKRCPQCNSENSDSMNFCLQCGAALPQTPVNSPDDPPPTQIYRDPQTNQAGGSRETFVNKSSNFAPDYAAQQAPPRKKSSAKIFLILGGVFALFLLFIFAGAAIVAYNIMSSPKTTANNNPNYPTPLKTPAGLSPASPTKTPSVKLPSSSPSAANSSAVPTPKSATDASGKLDRTWIDYNVTESGRTGMRIHNKFSAFNLKNEECYLAIYFQKEDGTRLTSDDANFRSATGNLALFKLLKPNYDNTIYDDIDGFIPYGEFNVAPGKHKLTLDIDLITKDGDLIEHLNFYSFEYERFADK